MQRLRLLHGVKHTDGKAKLRRSTQRFWRSECQTLPFITSVTASQLYAPTKTLQQQQTERTVHLSLSFFAVPVLNDTTSSFTCCLNMKLLSSQLWRSSPPCALWSKAWDAFSCVNLNRDGTRLNKARIQYARVFVNVVLLWPNWEEISEKCVYFSLCGGAVEMVVWGVEAKYK